MDPNIKIRTHQVIKLGEWRNPEYDIMEIIMKETGLLGNLLSMEEDK